LNQSEVGVIHAVLRVQPKAFGAAFSAALVLNTFRDFVHLCVFVEEIRLTGL
jgi:hypothetical protein